MIFIWCVLAATWLGICLKLFPIWKVNTFNAIVINYTTCLVLGLALDLETTGLIRYDIIQEPWFKFDILMGFLFITGFNLTAYAILHMGITLTVLMQKMSILLTVSFAVIMFNEHIGWLESIGLLMAFSAIITINLKPDKTKKISRTKRWIILSLVLVISATIEIVIFYVQETKIVIDQQKIFTSLGFGFAAIIGWIMIMIRWISKKGNLRWKDLFAGILLGLPNYFSIYLLLVMLQQGWDGSVLYPLLNVSVLLLSTLVGLTLFREKLHVINWVGVGFAIMGILIIAYAQNHFSW